MKKLFLTLGFLLPTFSLLFAETNNSTFIKEVKTKTDILYNGAHGISINTSYDFSDLKKDLQNDSLLNASNFLLTIIFKDENNVSVDVVSAYGEFKTSNKQFQYSKRFQNNISAFTKGINNCFVPYAAFDLTEGKHTLVMYVTLSGKDGNGKSYFQQLKKENIVIQKKKQQTMTFNVDYVEVASVNKKGNVWDFSPFG